MMVTRDITDARLCRRAGTGRRDIRQTSPSAQRSADGENVWYGDMTWKSWWHSTAISSLWHAARCGARILAQHLPRTHAHHHLFLPAAPAPPHAPHTRAHPRLLYTLALSPLPTYLHTHFTAAVTWARRGHQRYWKQAARSPACTSPLVSSATLAEKHHCTSFERRRRPRRALHRGITMGAPANALSSPRAAMPLPACACRTRRLSASHRLAALRYLSVMVGIRNSPSRYLVVEA